MTSIEIRNLTKRFGTVQAVHDLTFDVSPGMITGFLGPNGAGKTTTMRMILGLVTQDSGTATIDGKRYADLPDPTATVGAVLDSSSFHPGRTARDHLRIYCAMGGYPRKRVDEVIGLLGISEFADRKTGGFSTGMRQRLNLATALLGDARALLLDEPSNGLDPQGIAWLRKFLRSLADEGRTVLVSSHMLSEVQQMVDRVVVIRSGELVTTGTLAELSATIGETVRVRSPKAELLAEQLRTRGDAVKVETVSQEELQVQGLGTAEIADLAAAHGIPVHELASVGSSLEQAFLKLTGDENEEDAR
ncbi:MAG: ABC transporter ATP-binding protein [Kibdelosporangium sp.]